MGPTVAGLGLAAVLAAAAGGGSHWDLEAWNLTWTLRPDDAFLIDGAPSGPVPKSPSTDGCP